MKIRDFRKFSRCTIDYPLEITTSEICSLTGPLNTILKSTYHLGISLDLEGTFQSLFNIAEEIAGVDSCAYIFHAPESDEFKISVSRPMPTSAADRSVLFAPAAIARHFGKTILLESGKGSPFLSICNAWSCASLLAFPLRRDRNLHGTIVFGKGKSGAFSTVDIKLLWLLAMQAENYLLRSEVIKSLAFYSFLDPLTHLHNQRYFDDQIEREIQRSRRNGKPFSLIMLGLDGFKSNNDCLLQSGRDAVLQGLAVILRNAVREVDTVARIGEGEFATILVECSAEGARDQATRFADRLEKLLLPGIDNQRTERISASIGIASFPADSFDRQDLLRKVDHALAMAKSQGGGKICLHHEIADPLTIKLTPDDIPIQKIYEAARTVVDMDKFLEILLFTAMQGLSAGRGSIVLLDSRGILTLRVAIGFAGDVKRFSPGATIPTGNVTSWVLEHGEPLVVSGQEDMPLTISKPLKKNGYQADSFLSIPLAHEGRQLGAIHLTNRRDRKPFTKEDLELFQPIAREIATVLSQGLTFRENLKTLSLSILYSLVNALELRFPFLSGHSQRVSDLSVRIGKKLGLDADALHALWTAAILHDIGIVGLPGSILFKKQRLNEKELEIVRKHPFLGSKLLEGVPGLEETRRMILEHHENFNGSGYPYGLQGEELSLGARILSVVEFFVSITSERPHRGKLLPEEAIQLVRNSENTHFDGNVCRAFREEILNPGNPIDSNLPTYQPASGVTTIPKESKQAKHSKRNHRKSSTILKGIS